MRDYNIRTAAAVVELSNSEGQTAGGTRERQQRRALATTPQGAGRVGVTKKAENLQGADVYTKGGRKAGKGA